MEDVLNGFKCEDPVLIKSLLKKLEKSSEMSESLTSDILISKNS